MRRLRFHLGTLVILVLLSGVGFGALRESNEIWDSCIFSFTLGLLLISVLLAIHQAEKRRAFWLGFALYQQGQWHIRGRSLGRWIEHGMVREKFGGIERHLRALCQDWSLAPGSDRSISGRAVFSLLVRQESGLIPSSAPMVEEIAEFWRNYYGIKK
jgi:hypothetical protein